MSRFCPIYQIRYTNKTIHVYVVNVKGLQLANTNKIELDRYLEIPKDHAL
jgi:hypothetical protein